MVKNSTPLFFTSRFLLECVLLLEKTNSVKAVCEKFGVSKQRFNYHLKKLKTLGIVEKRGYGVWVVNRENFYLLDKTKENVKQRSKKEVKNIAPSRWGGAVSSLFTSNNVSGHAYMWVLKTPGFPFERVRDRLDSGLFKVIPQGLSFDTELFSGWRVWLCRRSVVLYAPKDSRFFASDELLAYKSALSECLVVVRRLEKLLGFSLRFRKDYVLKPRREHNAHCDELVARGVSERGERFAVWDSSGVWLRVDSSLGVPELECEASGSSDRVEEVRDASRLVREDFNCLKDQGVTRQFLLEQDARIQGKLENYADNIETHVRVMRRIESLLLRFEKKE